MTEKYEASPAQSTEASDAANAEPNTEVLADAGDDSAVQLETAANKAKRWRLGRNKTIALGAALLLIGGGGAWAYNVYQAPTTVIGMAIGSLFGQQNPAYDLKLAVSSSGIKGDITLGVSTGDEGADLNALLNLNYAGQKASANVEAITAKSGDAYLQISKYESLLALFLNGAGLNASSYSSVLNAISGKWIKLSKSDIESVTGSTGTAASCIQDKYKDAVHAEAVKTEMINLAKSHVFMVVDKDLGTSNGSVGYDMAFDVPQLKAFLIGFLDTKAFADYEECSGSSAAAFPKEVAVQGINSVTEEQVKTAMATTKISIWADQWSHKLSKLSIVTNQSGLDLELDLLPAGDRSSLVQIPTDSISVTDLQSLLAGI